VAPPLFHRILIANRGEVAVRVARACDSLGIVPVFAVSDADRDAPYTQGREVVVLGPGRAAQSYLDVERVVQAAVQTRCSALHPGWGFLSENPLLATACAQHGVTLAVGFNWRFQPALQEIRRMLEDGRLGRLLHIEGNFCGPSAYRFPRGHWRHDRDAEAPAGGMTGRGVHVVDAMLYLGGHVETVHAQSRRLAQDFGMDDTTSMLFGFNSGATGYLGTFIATAETWRLQVFGSRGWAEVGDVEHLTTWELRTCFIDPQDIKKKQRPQLRTFPAVSTERAELERFAEAAAAGEPVARPGGDEVHNVAVFEAIVASAADHSTRRVL